MATYNFGSIGTVEASSYVASRDDLVFTGITGATATNIAVSGFYNLRIITTGSNVTLGNGAVGEVLTLPDGSILLLPDGPAATRSGTAAGDQLNGGADRDNLSGATGDDQLLGWGGDDTLTGGPGRDTLTGGASIDVFTFAAGDSGVTEGRLDVITDWVGFDRIAFSATLDGFQTATATTYAAALQAANAQIATGAADIVAVQVGFDVFVFADTRRDDSTADDAILLRSTNLNLVAGTSFIVDPTAPPPGPRRDGTTGNDSLTANDSGEQLYGLAGNDSLQGGRNPDTLQGGDGADTINGYRDNNFIFGGAGDDVIIVEGTGDTISTGPGGDLILARGGDTFSVVDWTATQDAIRFFIQYNGYAEAVADTEAAARILAGQLYHNGYGLVAIQVGGDVLVFGNTIYPPRFDTVVRLVGRTLDDISGINLGVTVTPAPVSTEAPPAPVRVTAGQAFITGNMDQTNFANLANAAIKEASLTRIVVDGKGIDLILTGTGFSTDTNRTTLFGSVTGASLETTVNGAVVQMNTVVPPTSLAAVVDALDRGSAPEVFQLLLQGADRIFGSVTDDLIRAAFGDDVVSGGGGNDTLWGGGGNDVIYATAPGGEGPAGSTYLRGEAGNDWIAGGRGFDDINGNEGNDTAAGGPGDDWVVGGKDGDRLYGEAGSDLVYGNLGADWCDGGEGDDIVRGGQDSDILFGGAGNDYLSGDKGSDTVAGGAGADIFHTFGDAGLDRVTDFNQGEGDRVMLDPGTQYTLSQLGPDTIINMTGGGQMILVGVTLSSLTPGWIFGA